MIRKQLVSILGSICLLLGVVISFALAAETALTPKEFWDLSKEEKLKSRTVVVRAGWWDTAFYNRKTLPEFADRILTCDLTTPINWYSLALFYLEHPNVRFEVGVTTADPAVLMAALAARTATAPVPIMCGGGPPAWVELGAVADITELVKDWDQVKYLEEFAPWKMCWVDGRCYAVPSGSIEVYMVSFRKDWFKEAGIFNEAGEPAPEDDWTYTDFRKIAVKLTDVKKKRWGMGYTAVEFGGMDQWAHIMASSFGVLEPWGYLIPDPSGECTWRFGVTPQLVETYQYLHDLRWKYQCMLSDVASDFPWDPVSKDFYGGRIGMVRDSTSNRYPQLVGKPSPFNIDHAAEEDIGFINMPTGDKTGLVPNLVCTNILGFPAYLSEEELKLAFEFFDWNVAGRGKTLYLIGMADKFRLLGPVAYPVRELGLKAYKPRGEIPSGLPLPEEIIPANWLEVQRKGVIVPIKPQPENFGLKVGVWSMPPEELPYLQAFQQMMIAEKDFDIEKELEKLAVQVNK